MKKNNKIKTIAIALIAVLIAGAAISALSMLGHLGGDVLPPVLNDDDEQVELLPVIPVGEFGGTTTYKDAFTGSSSAIRNEVGSVSTIMTDGMMKLSHEGTVDEYHVNLHTSTSGSLNASDYSFLTVDLDMKIEALDDRIDIYTIFCNDADRLIGSSFGHSQFLVIEASEGSYNIVLTENGVEIPVVSVSANETFHLTWVYTFDNNSVVTNANIYLNGAYIGCLGDFLATNVVTIRGFRIHQRESENLNSPDFIYVDNYTVNTFEKGYDGAINYLFNSTEYTLQECSDSVLFVPKAEAE